MNKISTLNELYDFLPEHERIMVDVLRNIVVGILPSYCKEKFSYNVPYFYGNKGICIIWPSNIPRGGISEGVLLGFWQGPELQDPENYLHHGTNQKVYYRIFKSVEDIDLHKIEYLLREAVMIDQAFQLRK